MRKLLAKDRADSGDRYIRNTRPPMSKRYTYIVRGYMIIVSYISQLKFADFSESCETRTVAAAGSMLKS